MRRVEQLYPEGVTKELRRAEIADGTAEHSVLARTTRPEADPRRLVACPPLTISVGCACDCGATIAADGAAGPGAQMAAAPGPPAAGHGVRPVPRLGTHEGGRRRRGTDTGRRHHQGRRVDTIFWTVAVRSG